MHPAKATPARQARHLTPGCFETSVCASKCLVREQQRNRKERLKPRSVGVQSELAANENVDGGVMELLSITGSEMKTLQYFSTGRLTVQYRGNSPHWCPQRSTLS